MSTKSIPPKEAFHGLVEALDDDSGLTDEEVAEELRAAGIDLAKAERKLDDALQRVINSERRQQLDHARVARLSAGRRDRLADIRSMRLPLPELRARVASMAGHAAHRELEAVAREDLESQLADLLDLEDGE